MGHVVVGRAKRPLMAFVMALPMDAYPVDARVEVKTGKDKLRPEQVRDVARLREDGIPVFEARSEVDMDLIVETMKAVSDAKDLRST